MLGKEDDVKSVEKILDGDVDEFEKIVDKYEVIVFKFIYSMIKNRENAQDITQEVFITVYNKLYTFDKKYKFSNWILRIAKNKCIDYIRKYKKVKETNIDDIIGLRSKDISPEQNAEFNETKKLVVDYVNQLNPVDKQIVMLRYAHNSTFSNIAEILEMSESAVKRRYYKLRQRFKENIAFIEKGCGYEL